MRHSDHNRRHRISFTCKDNANLLVWGFYHIHLLLDNGVGVMLDPPPCDIYNWCAPTPKMAQPA